MTWYDGPTVSFNVYGVDSFRPLRSSACDGYYIFSAQNITLEPWSQRIVSTGVVVSFPEGMYGRIGDIARPRSTLVVYSSGTLLSSSRSLILQLGIANMGSMPVDVRIGEAIGFLFVCSCNLPLGRISL